MNLNVDRSQWTKVRLGDVATEYSSRINDPSSGDRERFVGSSCIGQWDFRVQEWESTESVTSAMKLFEEGDYLLVRRSLYASDFRERAPRAHFAGVCSGDILTIRENPELIADGFLIGILNNPSIWSYIVANASGSITRRIKWKDLANYEFLLPPKDQQAEIAELLWGCSGLLEEFRESEKLARNSLFVHREKLLFHNVPGKWVCIGECGKEDIQVVQVGPFGGSLNSRHYSDSGTTVLKIQNMTEDGVWDFSKSVAIPSDYADSLSRYKVVEGDVVIAAQATVGRSARVTSEIAGSVISQHLIRIRVNEKVCRSRFLAEVLQLRDICRQIGRVKDKTTRAGLNSSDVSGFMFCLPDLNYQDDCILKLEELRRSIDSLEQGENLLFRLRQSLVGEIFGDAI